MKLCKTCQQDNRTKSVYCSTVCKERFQEQKKVEHQNSMDRQRLIGNCSISQKLIVEGLPTPKKNTYGEVISSLILRVHGTSEKSEKYFDGYWHPSASDPIIVDLDYIKEEIGDEKLDSYGYWKLKSVVESADCNVVQYLWLVLASNFLYSHFHDTSFYSKSLLSAKIKGCIEGARQGELYSSNEKGKLTSNIGGQVKGIVPPGCSLNGIVFGMERGETKEHTFTVGETFYADVQRCPFSSGIYDSTEFVAKDTKYELPLMLDTNIGSTLIWEEVTKNLDAYGPSKVFGEIPLQWFTHYRRIKIIVFYKVMVTINI